MSGVPFTKYHALGNDYIVVDASRVGSEFRLTSDFVRAICDRTRGVGSDGVLWGRVSGGEFGLSIWNPDGTEAEKSGNGLRIFARYLSDRRYVETGEFQIQLPNERVQARRLDRTRFEVSMGEPEILEHLTQLEVGGERLDVFVVSVGNPHCVVVGLAPDEAVARRLGPLIENHPRFPNRTNVQFVEALDPQSIRIEIWERGAGYTLASGSSSVAAAAVARTLGWVADHVCVSMPGGRIDVRFDQAHAAIRGSTTHIAEGIFELI
jgi:diaminopimelate epimerase